MNKKAIIVIWEITMLGLGAILYLTVMDGFEYKALMIFPLVLMMVTSAVVINMLIDSKAHRESKRGFSKHYLHTQKKDIQP